MEEQKLRMKPALKQQTNVQRIKSVAEKEQHKCTKNYKLNSRELVWCIENIYNIKKIKINIIAKTIYKILVIES